MTRRLRARLLVELDGAPLVDEQLHLEQRTDPPRGSDGMPWLDLFADVTAVARRARDRFYTDHPFELEADTGERNPQA